MNTPRATDAIASTKTKPPPEAPLWRRPLLLAAAALLAGLLLRILCIAAFSRVAGDTLLYGDIASNWLQHGVYGFTSTLDGAPAPPRPTLIRLPGYPLFLLLCFRLFGVARYTPILFLQAAIDLAGCCLLAASARRLFGARAALPALWLATLCPFTALYVATPLTETLVLFCITLAFYALLRWQAAKASHNRWLFLLACALGYSILLRPEQGILAAAILPAMLWISFAPGPERSLSAKICPTLIVALLTLLPLIPWTLRNERTFHLFQPLAPRYANDPGEPNPYGFQRWFRTWAIDFASTESTYWPYDGEPLQLADLPTRAFDSQAQLAETTALLADYNRDTSSTPKLDARFNAIALDRIHAAPLRYYVALPLARVANMIFRPRAELLPIPLEWWVFSLHPASAVAATALAALNLAYLTLAALALRRRRTLTLDYPAARPILWSMLATILLRAALLLTLDNSETRYTLEFYPILIVLAAGLLASRFQSS